MSKLRVSPVADDELPEAYPLVRCSLHIGLGRWLAFARALSSIHGGVLGARAGGGCFYGVATFIPLPDLRYERMLIGEVVVAIDLSGAGQTRAALCTGLEEIAARLRCRELAMLGNGRADVCTILQRGVSRTI